MTRKVLKGEDISVLYSEKGALHAESHTLDISIDTDELRTKDTNGKELEAGDTGWSIDVSGLVIVDDDKANGNHTPFDTLDLTLAKQLVPVVFSCAAYGPAKYGGMALITKFSTTGKVGDTTTYSATLTGSGDFAKITATETETVTENS